MCPDAENVVLWKPKLYNRQSYYPRRLRRFARTRTNRLDTQTSWTVGGGSKQSWNTQASNRPSPNLTCHRIYVTEGIFCYNSAKRSLRVGKNKTNVVVKGVILQVIFIIFKFRSAIACHAKKFLRPSGAEDRDTHSNLCSRSINM